jgi:asparagine synthase (glutamine-hydrolysing)
MCGISGIAGEDWNANLLYSMTKIQSHRGPDNEGHFINTNQTIGLGHTRLSIIDLTDSANCPMSDENGNITVVFNGEIYNYLELKQQLNHYSFQTTSDTEVILASYIKWGEKCVDKFIGMFSFAIWDESKNILFCSRDRLGIKPFYYHLNNNTLYFASEIKALLACGIPSKPNWKQWSTYLTTGYYDHSEDTFFENIQTLPGGHNLIFKNKQVQIYPYWQLQESIEGGSESSLTDYCEELKYLVSDSIKLHMRSDVPISVNLSGGLDSGILATMIDALHMTQPMTTFTSAFADHRYDESNSIPNLGLTNFNHVKHITHASSIPRLTEELLWFQEAPFGGIPTLAYYDLHKTIHKYSNKVSMEGQGFDELFAGYRYVQPYHYADIVTEHGWNELEKRVPPQCLSDITKMQIRSILKNDWQPQSQDSTEHLQTKCLSKEISQFDNQFSGFNRPFTKFLDNILYQDLIHTKLPRVLRMNDKLSMASGIELRVPFLDHRIVEFAFRLPNHLKIRNGQGKFILRHMAQPLLPKTLTAQEKISVVTPQTSWLKKELKSWVLDIINSSSFKTRGLFDHKMTESAYTQFQNIEQDNSFFVWQWINTELWFQKFIDGNPFQVV